MGRSTTVVPKLSDDNGSLRGWRFAAALAAVVLLSAVYVVWRCFKHNWLIDHGYLPEAFRSYWLVYAVVLIVLVAWAAFRRFRS
jgi:uncharacterized membrane protein YphA (DoxX/SURF4 family)